MECFIKVEQDVLKNGWRKTTYERLDGTRFQVAIPKNELIDDGHATGSYRYNEHHEMTMALSLYKIGGRVHDTQ